MMGEIEDRREENENKSYRQMRRINRGYAIAALVIVSVMLFLLIKNSIDSQNLLDNVESIIQARAEENQETDRRQQEVLEAALGRVDELEVNLQDQIRRNDILLERVATALNIPGDEVEEILRGELEPLPPASSSSSSGSSGGTTSQQASPTTPRSSSSSAASSGSGSSSGSQQSRSPSSSGGGGGSSSPAPSSPPSSPPDREEPPSSPPTRDRADDSLVCVLGVCLLSEEDGLLSPR